MKRYTHLSTKERYQILILAERGASIRSIAKELERRPSTISRELIRNKPHGKLYDPEIATEKAKTRHQIKTTKPRKLTRSVIARILLILYETQASPEQIAGVLKKDYGINISHETIYQFIWANKRRGGQLYKHLRHGSKKYNKRGAKAAGRGLIPNRVDISLRPKIVERKKRFGDFEIDTIVGVNHQGGLLSIVDRASKFTLLELLKDLRAETVTQALTNALTLFGQNKLIHTITSDNGKEFAYHQNVTKNLGGAFYFATPYHSWERGLNEHTNGLVRQYFPKGTSFDTISHEEVAKVATKLNHRPRKVLKFRTPVEVLQALTGVVLPSVALCT